LGIFGVWAQQGWPQPWDSVWVSLEPSAPYAPTTFTQVYVGETLSLRIGFSTEESLSQFTVGLLYDIRKFDMVAIGFDVLDAETGQPFGDWTFWSPTSFAQTCGIPIGDSLCMATWFGMTLMGSLFPLPSGAWMVGTLQLLATDPGPTLLVPAYLDTSTLKVPIPLAVEIRTAVQEPLSARPGTSQWSITYLARQHLLEVSSPTPIRLTLSLWDPLGRRLFAIPIKVSSRRTTFSLAPYLQRPGIYFLEVASPAGVRRTLKLLGG